MQSSKINNFEFVENDFSIIIPEFLREKVSMITIRAGTPLFKKEDSAKYVYILVDGTLDVINEFENGSVYVFDKIKSLCLTGELEYFANKDYYATTNTAKTDCKVIPIEYKDFKKWLDSDSKMLNQTAKFLALKMFPRSKDNGQKLFLKGQMKLQHYILNYCQENGEKDNKYIIQKTRQEIADETGISIKTVNRCVSKLRDNNEVIIEKGSIVLTQELYENLLYSTETYI